jgi:hypothetical protein
MQDPQSLHKYAYVHGDPISGVDPTGKFVGTVVGLIGGILGGFVARSKHDAVVTSTGFSALALLKNTIGYASFMYGGNLVFSGAYFAFMGAVNPFSNGEIGELTSSTKATYKANVKNYLDSIVNNRFNNGEVDATGREQGLNETDAIAQAYVDAVFDNKATRGGWLGNLTGSGLKCVDWVERVSSDARIQAATSGTMFKLRTHFDVQKFGWYNSYTFLPVVDAGSIYWFLPIHPLHSFTTLTFNETEDQATGKVSFPDVVLDPWSNNAPDIYAPRQFHRTWPLNISAGNTNISTH